jgi:hypothetical protein
VPPGYGTPGGRPPGSGDSNRTAVIAAAVVVALLLLGGVLLVLLRSDHKAKSSANPTDSIARSDSASGFPSSTPGDSTPPTSSDFPTDAAPGGSGSVSEADAKSVVGQYLDDINAQDRNHAATLICPEIVDKWRSSIDQPSGDFTVTITDRTYQGSATNDPGLDVKYLLSVKDRNSAKTGSSTVTFTVVDEGGAKICGEK